MIAAKGCADVGAIHRLAVQQRHKLDRLGRHRGSVTAILLGDAKPGATPNDTTNFKNQWRSKMPNLKQRLLLLALVTNLLTRCATGSSDPACASTSQKI